MKPFPPAEKFSFLQGNEVSSVTLGPYQIDIQFVEGSSLNIEHGLEYTDADGLTHTHDPQRRSGPDPVTFHHLVGDCIARIETSGLRMTFTFVSGRKLIVLSQEGPYESGHINHIGYDEETNKLKQLNLIVFQRLRQSPTSP